MTLNIYKQVDESYVVLTSDFTTPLSTTHDGKNGSTSVVQIFIRNDNINKWYSNIRIRPEDTNELNPYEDVSYSQTGWGVKLSSGASEPTDAEWEDINWGEEIRMSDIGSDSAVNTTTYYPFWYLITSPPNVDAQNKRDIQLRYYYTENAVI